MMIMAGCKISHFTIFGGTGAVLGSTGLYVLAKEFGIGAYRLKRLIAFANPWADPLDTGWQNNTKDYMQLVLGDFWSRPWKQ